VSALPEPQPATQPRTIIRPVGKRVLVQRVEAAKASKGGVLLPDDVQAREKPNEGVVLAVGNECGRQATQVEMLRLDMDPSNGVPQLVPFQPGDVVLFGAYAGLQLGGEEANLLLLGEDEVVAVRSQVAAAQTGES
jgi:chaperonin GroES